MIRHELADGRTLRIREAGVDDARALLDYVAVVAEESDYLTFGPGEFGLGETEEREFLAALREADNQIFLLALLDGAIVGAMHFTGGVRPRMRYAGEMGMSVRREFWGLGIGGRLIDALIGWAREGGIVKKIDLRVRTDNPRAIRLYERKGFVREGTLRKQIVVNGHFFDHHWMGLEID